VRHHTRADDPGEKELFRIEAGKRHIKSKSQKGSIFPRMGTLLSMGFGKFPSVSVTEGDEGMVRNNWKLRFSERCQGSVSGIPVAETTAANGPSGSKRRMNVEE
jgi:hypothetical protein